MSIWTPYRTIVVSPIIAAYRYIYLYIDLSICCVCVYEEERERKSNGVLYKWASKCTRRIKWKSAKYAEKDHHKKYMCSCECECVWVGWVYGMLDGMSYVLYTSAALCANDHNGTAMLTSDADINTNQYICFFKSYFCSFDRIAPALAVTLPGPLFLYILADIGWMFNAWVCACMCVCVFFWIFFSASIGFEVDGVFSFIYFTFTLMQRKNALVLFAPFCLCLADFFSIFTFLPPCDTFLELLLVSYRCHLCVAFPKMNGIQYCDSRLFLALSFSTLAWCAMLLLFGHQKNGQIWLNKSQNGSTDKEARGGFHHIFHMCTINKSYLYVLGQAYWWIWLNRNQFAREKWFFGDVLSHTEKRTRIERILNYYSNSTIIIRYSFLLPLKPPNWVCECVRRAQCQNWFRCYAISVSSDFWINACNNERK